MPLGLSGSGQSMRRRVDLVFGCNLLRRLVTTQRLKRYCGLKLVRKTASLRHLCILSSMLDTS